MTLANAVRRLNRTHSVPAAILVTDEHRLPDPLPAIRRLPTGGAVLLRHSHAPEREKLARILVKHLRSRRLGLLISSDWQLAARLGADGLHLPEALARSGRIGLALGWARRRGAIVTMACHSPGAVAVARRLGVDAAILSPVFGTKSHPGAASIGAARFRLWSRRAGIPIIALGGVDSKSAKRLRGAALAGIAAIDGWGR